MMTKHGFSRTALALLCVLCMVPALVAGCAPQPVPASSSEPEPSSQPEQSSKEADDGIWPADFSLKETYRDYFLLGTTYNDASRSGATLETTLKHFNSVTPENCMKPEYMQPAEGVFNYKESDVLVDFAAQNSLMLIGHTLAWHQQSGNWLGRTTDREQAIAQLRSHITSIVGNYKGTFLAWDVVNEAVEDGVSLPSNGDWTVCLRKTQWLESIGPDYLAMAFRFAREADPDLKLYYNDYNLNVKQKADVVYAMVKDLRSQNVPIDGIGMQGHYTHDTSAATVKESLELFASLGVEVSITELDVAVNGADASKGLTQAQQTAQAITYAKLFKVFKDYKDSLARVTFWGFLDSTSWRSDRFPSLFNADFTPKQAAYAVLDPDKYLELYDTEADIPAKVAQAKYGTPAIDAEVDDLWSSCTAAEVNIAGMAWEGAKGTVRALWDEHFIYVLFDVQDTVLNKLSENAYEQDSIEIFLDQNNEKSASYGPDDGQYRVNFDNEQSFGTIPEAEGFKSAAKKIDGGYRVELAIPLLAEVAEGAVMGFDAQVNDSDETGARISIMKFNDPTDNSYQNTEKWGELKLVK